MRLGRLIPLALALSAAPAIAEDREFCAERPGLETPPCIVDAGHVQVEVGLGDWTLDKQPGTREDTVLVGDFLARLGVTDTTEVQLGWTPYGHVRTRDTATGMVERQGRVGDVTLALKQNFRNPDGSGLSLAVKPYATLPVGREPVGAGDWGAGMIGAVGYQAGPCS